MFELVLLADEPVVEALTDELIDTWQALSAAVEDADAASPHEQALFGEPGLPVPQSAWPHSRVVALFANEASAQAAAAGLLAQRGDGDTLRIEALRELAEQDWVRLTQSQFEPVAITDRFWIVPSWHEVPAAAARAIRLDPGLAFGTGTHPTTRMCLRWIARHADVLAPSWQRTLDYGCGSGVLAIAAALHGAGHINAVDIDPAAVRATLDNAQANGVDASAPELSGGASAAAAAPAATLLQVGLPGLAGAPARRYAVVLANILASPLKLLAPLLSAHLAAGGRLVLAGILERQVDELGAAYAPALALEVADREDGWVLMTARRDAAPSA